MFGLPYACLIQSIGGLFLPHFNFKFYLFSIKKYEIIFFPPQPKYEEAKNY